MYVEDKEMNLRGFFDNFLDIVFAETSMADGVELVNEGQRFGLAHCNHPYIIGAAAGSLRRDSDTVKHRPQRRHYYAFHGRSRHRVGMINGRLKIKMATYFWQWRFLNLFVIMPFLVIVAQGGSKDLSKFTANVKSSF